jgi:hypothetical protein
VHKLLNGRRALLLIAFTAVVALAGCAGPQAGRVRASPEVLRSVKPGISTKELEDIVGRKPQHEFLSSQTHADVHHCISYYFLPSKRLFFIFTNDALAKVILPPQFPRALSPGEQSQRAVWHSYDPQHRITVALNAPALGREQFARKPKPHRTSMSMDNAPPAVLAAVLLLPLAPVIIPIRIAEYQKQRADVQRFSGLRAKLGMTPAEVDALYGPPLHAKQQAPEQELRLYGPPDLKHRFQHGHCHVAVIFQRGKSMYVLSDQFLPRSELEHLQHASKR